MFNNSKSLGIADDSGFYFAQEMLDGDPTAGINFDRLQYHPKYGYIIFEYLLCDEKQLVNPFTSHPNRYWYKNKRKFLALWKVSQDLNARLFLVNYAKLGTKHEDKVKLIYVKEMNETGIKEEKDIEYTREEFKKFFKNLNKECLEG